MIGFVVRTTKCPKSNDMDAKNNITRKSTTERIEDMEHIHDVELVHVDVKQNGELMYILVINIEVWVY